MTTMKLLDLVLWILLLSINVLAQRDPCSSSSSAVYLPQDGLCLVVEQGGESDWLGAQRQCEASGGSLVQVDARRGLLPEPRAARCLAANSTGALLGGDWWMGVVGQYSRHWFWVNDTLLNPVSYRTEDRDNAFLQIKAEICSNYLSIDYCVYLCHQSSIAYAVIYRQSSAACCFCSLTLEQEFVTPIPDSPFNAPQGSSYFYVAEAREGNSMMVSLTSTAFTYTDTLCATVNVDTLITRELQSASCYAQYPFLCSLGSNSSLPCEACQGERCSVRMGSGDCVQRDSRPLKWFVAREECRALGGDLWRVNKLDDMKLVGQLLQDAQLYWVGATNHYISFKPDSTIFGANDTDLEEFRCGHMTYQGSEVSFGSWNWTDERCGGNKSFICQYEQSLYTAANSDSTVICPWPIPTPLLPTTPHVPVSSVTSNGTFIIEDTTQALVAGSFPFIPIIAAIVAAMLILMCCVCMVICSRRRKHWLKKKWRRTLDYVWPLWASTPTYLTSHASEAGLESLSTAHTGVHSDRGSVFLYPDVQTPRTPRPPSSVGGFGAGVLGGEGDGNVAYSSLDVIQSPREYVTLSAHMNILDDDGDTVTGSMRGKPEVALVTDDVDLSFTVNHAYPRPNPSSPRPDPLNLNSPEAVHIPTRTVEQTIFL